MSTLTEQHERQSREKDAARIRARITELRAWIPLSDFHDEFKASPHYTEIIQPAVAKVTADFLSGVLSIPLERFHDERRRVLEIAAFSRDLVRHAGRKDEYERELADLLKKIEDAEASGRISTRA